MSKVSFRARQIDFNKPLPIVKDGSDILAEFSENAFVNRGVPQIPSGMEKEEENEHHFLEVIQALQLNSSADVKIPVPDIIDTSTSYKKLYSNEFTLPNQLVHIRNVVLAEDEPTEYDMDTEDEEWLSRSQLDVSPRKFESMIDRLERGCGQKVMNLEEANYLLQDDPSIVIAVYDYWLNKRVQSRQPLLFAVRQERRDGGNNADPYVAFRRRSEKMQTRKNRKNDEHSYEKMLILRDQMDTLGEILSLLVKRETTKEALVQNNLRVFETRCRLQDWDGLQMLDAENLARKSQRPSEEIGIAHPPKESIRKRSARKRKLTHRILNLSIRMEDTSDTERNEANTDGPFAFVRMQGCRYLRPRDVADQVNVQPREYHHPHLRYSLTTVPSVCHPERRTYTGYIRRRLGRGGRIIYDRLQPPADLVGYLRSYDQQKVPTSRSSPNANFPTHLHTRQSQVKDVDLLRRLKPVLLSSHRRRPSFHWPICTEFPHPPSFEPLRHNPWRVTAPCAPNFRTSTNPSPPRTTESAAPVQLPEISSSDSFQSFPPGSNGVYPTLLESNYPTALTDLAVERCDVQDESNKNFPKKPVLPSSSPPGSNKQSLLAVNDNKTTSTPNRFWKNLTRFDSFQPPNFPRSRGAETSVTGVNGISPRLSHPSDDRLRLTNPSLLPPPKVCSLARDCVSRDPGVHGPHLQTANGVGPTQFFQLPT